MPRLVRSRLATLMFVFYFALGAWVVTLSTYLMSAPIKGGLNFTTGEVGLIYSTFAFGGMCAPLVIGVLTDRLFRAERVLGIACLLSAVLLFLAARWCDDQFTVMDEAYRTSASSQLVAGRPVLEQWQRLEAHEVPPGEEATIRTDVRLALDRVNEDPAVRQTSRDTFRTLFLIMLLYCICTQLVLTLTTVITLRNVPDPAHDFSRVRLFGTVGWIATGNVVGLLLRPASSDVLYLSAAATLLTGLYAFTLPATRPKGTGRSLVEAFGLPALRLFKDRSFVIFVFIAFFTTAMNQFYVVYGHRYLTDIGVPQPVGLMTIAQVCEVCCMFAIPLIGARRRMKLLMVLGLGGYLLRAAVLTIGWVPGVIALGVPMHGWGYAFFFMVAATYLDREAPPHLRASAQGIITFVSGGIGVLAGNTLAASVVNSHRVGTVIEWPLVWQVQLVGSVILFLAFVLFFHAPPERSPGKGLEGASHEG